jgi:hypothetical protein
MMINRFGFISALLLCFATVGVAQTAGGVAGISGTVHDPSGASVPGAKVVVANQALGVARNLTTNDAGLFTAPALTPGTGYSIDVTASGFAGYSAKDLTLQVGQNLDLDVALSVGQTTTEVQVNEAAQLIADQRPPRRFVRPADTRRHQRRHVRPADVPRRRQRQQLFARR